MAFNAARNDVSKFTEGAWCTIFGGQFKIARAGNPVYQKALRKSQSRNDDQLEPEEQQKRQYRAMAEGILVDWNDVTDNDGKPIKYSIDNAIQVMLDNPELVNAILVEANTSENYRRDDLESEKGKQ